MRQKIQALVMFAALLTTSVVFAADTYTIDPNAYEFWFYGQAHDDQ